jgi:hypothetical protein
MVSASRLNSLVLQGAAGLKPVQKFVERRRYAIGVNRKPKSNHPTHQQEPTNSAVHFYRGLSPISFGRYLYRGVIQEKDILRCEDGMVTY